MQGSHSYRVLNGLKIEDEVCGVFGLGKGRKRGASQPDILDYPSGVIGEVKSFFGQQSIVVYTDQLRRYLQMPSLKQTSLCEGEIKTAQLDLFYFFVKYAKSDRFVGGYVGHITETYLEDIYLADAGLMKEFLQTKKQMATKWAGGRPYIRIKSTELIKKCPLSLNVNGLGIHYRTKPGFFKHFSTPPA